MHDLNEYNNSKSLDLISCQCDNCQKSFKRIKKNLKHSFEVRKQTYLFCSNKCVGEFNKKRKEPVFCKQCGKEVSIYPNVFCSKSCSGSYNSVRKPKKKVKVKKIKKEKIYKPKVRKEKFLTCKICNTEFKSKNNASCCSVHCRKIALSQAGLKSVTVQKESRRSKNEMLFADLCSNHFGNTTTNEPIFNGWDADIILKNEKVAVLWNGKWHYEKITEKHSVGQVQNRDKIKIREICSLGFKPYIVKDMGKFNKTFVLSEFEKLKSFVSSL